ncbi:hypothetical protein M5K25_001779 [Dendrobium thyrsiflorum]|uniref:DUF659 domain-containing protein n=1 Tax=Dendrobium thyrsiflorum TaxID=117978 RepID=A0ABD0VQY0_DENTH
MNQIKETVEERMSSMEGQVADLRDMMKKMLEFQTQSAASDAKRPEARNTNSEIRREEEEVEIVEGRRGRPHLKPFQREERGGGYGERQGHGGVEPRGAGWEHREGQRPSAAHFLSRHHQNLKGNHQKPNWELSLLSGLLLYKANSLQKGFTLRSFWPLSPDNGHSHLHHKTTVLLTLVTRQRSFRPPSLADKGLFDLHLPPTTTTVFLTSVARRLRSFRPQAPDNGLSDLRRPLSSVLPTSSTGNNFLTSVARQQRSFRPPSPADYGPYDPHCQLLSFRPQSPDNCLSDLRRPPSTILTISFDDYGPSDLRRQTTVFPTFVACRLRSLEPPLPTTVLPTSVTRQWSFRPLSPVDYGPYDLLCRLRSFRPPSLDNDLSELCRQPTTVFPTSVACQQRSFQPPSPVDYGPYDLLYRLRSFRPPSLDNGQSSHRPRRFVTIIPKSALRLRRTSLASLNDHIVLDNRRIVLDDHSVSPVHVPNYIQDDVAVFVLIVRFSACFRRKQKELGFSACFRRKQKESRFSVLPRFPIALLHLLLPTPSLAEPTHHPTKAATPLLLAGSLLLPLLTLPPTHYAWPILIPTTVSSTTNKERLTFSTHPSLTSILASKTSANEYIDRILYQLTLAVEEHIHPERWEIISRHPPPPTPATFPPTGILRALLLVAIVLLVLQFHSQLDEEHETWLRVVKGGVTRMKEHLSCSHKNVAPCASVPDNVKDEIAAYMKKSTTTKHLQHEQFDERVEQGAYYGSESGKGSSSTINIRGTRAPRDLYMDRGQTQMMPAAGTREGRRQNAIPFNVATSPAYFNMLRSVGLYGRGLKAPSMYELRTWILKEELHNTEQSIEEIKRTWSETGVTIMSDGWSDMKSRSLINILVNNTYGTVFLRSIEASDEMGLLRRLGNNWLYI